MNVTALSEGVGGVTGEKAARRSSIAARAEAPAIIRLLIKTAGRTARKLEFDIGHCLTLGSADPADLRVDDPRLSRLHARFEREAAGVRITDLGSDVGTFVRGMRVREALLKPGDSAVLGDTTVLVHASPLRSVTDGGVAKLGAAASEPEGMTEPEHRLNLRARVQAYEARLIREALGLTGGNQRRAAALLELPLRTFERKLRKLVRQQRRTADTSEVAAPVSSEQRTFSEEG